MHVDVIADQQARPVGVAGQCERLRAVRSRGEGRRVGHHRAVAQRRGQVATVHTHDVATIDGRSDRRADDDGELGAAHDGSDRRGCREVGVVRLVRRAVDADQISGCQAMCNVGRDRRRGGAGLRHGDNASHRHSERRGVFGTEAGHVILAINRYGLRRHETLRKLSLTVDARVTPLDTIRCEHEVVFRAGLEGVAVGIADCLHRRRRGDRRCLVARQRARGHDVLQIGRRVERRVGRRGVVERHGRACVRAPRAPTLGHVAYSVRPHGERGDRALRTRRGGERRRVGHGRDGQLGVVHLRVGRDPVDSEAITHLKIMRRSRHDSERRGRLLDRGDRNVGVGRGVIVADQLDGKRLTPRALRHMRAEDHLDVALERGLRGDSRGLVRGQWVFRDDEIAGTRSVAVCSHDVARRGGHGPVLAVDCRRIELINQKVQLAARRNTKRRLRVNGCHGVDAGSSTVADVDATDGDVAPRRPEHRVYKRVGRRPNHRDVGGARTVIRAERLHVVEPASRRDV